MLCVEVITIDGIIGNYYGPTHREIIIAIMLPVLALIISIRKKNWTRLQRIVLPLFVFYVCAVLGITVFYRLPYDYVRYNTELFWSYKKAQESGKLLVEIALNYLMLLPFGVMASLYHKRRWVVITGFLFSTAIELTQFFMQRGLFEFDDIIGNTLGVIIGVGVYSLLRTL